MLEHGERRDRGERPPAARRSTPNGTAPTRSRSSTSAASWARTCRSSSGSREQIAPPGVEAGAGLGAPAGRPPGALARADRGDERRGVRDHATRQQLHRPPRPGRARGRRARRRGARGGRSSRCWHHSQSSGWCSGPAACTLGPIAYLVGELRLLLDRPADAAASFELALARSRAMGARPLRGALAGRARRRAAPGSARRPAPRSSRSRPPLPRASSGWCAWSASSRSPPAAA